MTKGLIIFTLLAAFAFGGAYERPRATAKFCVNTVIENDAMPKVQKFSQSRGCPHLVVTRIDDNYSHVYSVIVYVGE